MKYRRFIPVLLLLGAILRLALIFYPPYAVDIENFLRTGYITSQGWNIYQLQPYYNYSPVLAYLCAFLYGISNHLLYVGVHRALLVLVDIATALLIVRLTRDRWVTAVYWFVGSMLLYAGQFDTLSLFPLLGAVAVPPLTFVLGLTGILIKQSALPFVWVLFVHQFGVVRGVGRMVAVGAIFALSFAPYLPDGLEAIWQNVIHYSYGRGGGSNPLLALILYGGLVLLPICLRRKPLTERLFIQSLWLYLWMPQEAGQYLAYPLLFAAVDRRWRWVLGFGLILALISVRSTPEQWILIGLPMRFWVGVTFLTWAYPVLARRFREGDSILQVRRAAEAIE